MIPQILSKLESDALRFGLEFTECWKTFQLGGFLFKEVFSYRKKEYLVITFVTRADVCHEIRFKYNGNQYILVKNSFCI